MSDAVIVLGGGAARTPRVIAAIFANRTPSKIEALFAAAHTAGPGKYIPIATVDEALVGLGIEERLVIKSELRQRRAIA